LTEPEENPMAQQIAKLNTRVLVATGDSAPTEIGTIESNLYARPTHTDADLVFNKRRWRRALAVTLLRMAWAAWTMKDTK